MENPDWLEAEKHPQSAKLTVPMTLELLQRIDAVVAGNPLLRRASVARMAMHAGLAIVARKFPPAVDITTTPRGAAKRNADRTRGAASTSTTAQGAP